MKKIVLILLSLIVSAIIYLLFFTKQERKATKVRKNMSYVHTGMSVLDVKRILTEPDTSYLYAGTRYGSGVTVLQYYQGFGAPDVLRVLIRKDTVVDVIAND